MTDLSKRALSAFERITQPNNLVDRVRRVERLMRQEKANDMVLDNLGAVTNDLGAGINLGEQFYGVGDPRGSSDVNPATGVWTGYPALTVAGTNYYWAALEDAAVQVGYTTDGGWKAGAGAVTLDVDGISIEQGSGDVNNIKFKDGANILAYLGSDLTTTSDGGYNHVYLNSQDAGGAISAEVSLQATVGTDYSKLSVFKDNLQIISPLVSFSTPPGKTCYYIFYDSSSGTLLSMQDAGINIAAALTAPLTAGNNNYVGNTATINDDAFTSFTPGGGLQYGVILLNSRNTTTYQAVNALVAYRTAATAWTTIISGGANVEVTTGALNGTTGTDGKFTISVHTDGKIYLENRLGSNGSWSWVIMGR